MSPSEGDRHRHARLARSSSGVLLTNGVAAVALLGTAVLTARALGPSGRGEFSLAVSLVILAAALCGLSIGSAAAYYTARAPSSGPLAFGNVALVGLLLGLGIVGTGYVVILGGDLTLRGVPKADLLVALLALPFLLGAANIQSVYQGLRRFRAYNGITVAQATLPLPLIGIALALGGGVRAAIVAMVAAAVMLFLAVVVITRRATRIRWRLDLPYIRALASYGIRLHPANMLAYLGYRIDVFLVDGYKGAAAVGFYGAGVVIAEGLWMPSQAVSTTLFPTIAAEQSESARRAMTPLVTRNTLWLTTILGGILFLVASPVVDLLYSSRFSASSAVVRILVPGIVLFAAARVLGNDVAARGRPLVSSVLAAAVVACNIALNVLLIPRYGIEGAAWASTGSYSLAFLASAGVYRTITGVPLRALVVPSREDGRRYVRLVERIVRRPAEDLPAITDELAPTEEAVPADVVRRRD
jgi:O-antigen/teichoic acid export membrane protein